ncbi:MAG: SCO family protein [Phycisphaerales bacterium]
MSRFLKWVMLISGTVFVCSVSTLLILGASWGKQAKAIAALVPDENVRTLRLPPFQLTDQHGRPQDLALFQGEVTVLTFMFSSCPFACPTLTRGMWEMQQSLKDTRVRFASITVDPTRDTPARLLEYASGNDADLSRWAFLTGEMPTIRAICCDALHYNLADDPAQTITLPEGGTMNNISHPTRYTLIGPSGNVLAIFGSDEAARNDCINRARAASEANRK